MTISTKTTVKTTRLRIASLDNNVQNVKLIETIKANIATAQKGFPVNSKVVVIRRNNGQKIPKYFDVYLVQESQGCTVYSLT